jgi:hypothetical protein
LIRSFEANGLYKENIIAVPIPNSKIESIPTISENNEFTLNSVSPNWDKNTFLTINIGIIERK